MLTHGPDLETSTGHGKEDVCSREVLECLRTVQTSKLVRDMGRKTFAVATGLKGHPAQCLRNVSVLKQLYFDFGSKFI